MNQVKSTYLINYNEIAPCIIDSFEQAQESIYYAAWVLNFDYPIRDNLTFLDLINKTTARGVKIYILLCENIMYPYTTPKNLPNNCEIKLIPYFGKSTTFFNRQIAKLFFLQNKTYLHNGHLYTYHQKYMLIDQHLFMLGGTDIEAKRFKGIIFKKPLTKAKGWREIAVLTIPDEKIINFSKLNYLQGGNFKIVDNKWVGSFSDVSTEQNIIVRLIKSAKHSIFIENQYFLSIVGGNHKVINTLIAKLASMMRKELSFQVLVITNSAPHDTTNRVSHFVYTTRFKETVHKIYVSLIKKGFSLEKIEKYFLLTEIVIEKAKIFTHFKMLIQDETTILVSTTNICDRSLAHGNSDRELGMVNYARPDEAKLLLAKIYADFIKNKKSMPKNFQDFYEMVKSGETYIKPIDPALLPVPFKSTLFFIMVKFYTFILRKTKSDPDF